MLVPVDPRVKFFLRIVEVKRGKPFDTNLVVEFRECSFVALSCSNILACGKSMLGIKAHPQTVAFSSGIEHSDDVLEAISEI